MKIDREVLDAMRPQLGWVQSILITGASGVIGHSLVSLLLELRSEGCFKGVIYAVSNSRPVERLEVEFGDKIFRGSLVDRDFVASLPQSDIVIHAASPSAPSEFMARPAETILLNVDATIGLRAKAVRSFVFLSTSEIYSGLEHSATESEMGTTNTLHPRAAYIESKRVGEVATLMTTVNEANPEKCLVFRIALAYGAEGVEVGDSRLLYDLVRRAILEDLLTLSGDTSMIRSYSFAPDISALLLAITLLGDSGIYNLGSPDSRTLLQIAKAVALEANVPLHLSGSRWDVALGAPRVVRMDLTKLFSLFPKFRFTSLEEGLGQVVSRFRTALAENLTSETKDF